MASTSTNKQPLMQDRVLHEIVDLTNSTIAQNSRIDIGGSNSAALVVDCTQNDGAVICELYTLGRATDINADDPPDPSLDQEPYVVNVYLSTANDFLRDSQARFVAAWTTGGTLGTAIVDDDGNVDTSDPLFGRTLEGEKVVCNTLPYVLAPVPGVGSEDDTEVVGTQFQALYIPKGYALWAAVNQQSATDSAVNAPLIGAMGGYF